uniref:Uncharacterized protein n=1 Tax=Romanomermis culicivorax TaxID=13658 RepID=A0A915IEV4_ROMCU
MDVFKRPLSPIETKKHPFNHRLSVPSILEPDSQRFCRSSSFQNINSIVEQETAGYEDDEEIEEQNLDKNKANLSTMNGTLDLEKRRLNSRHRKASLSAIFLPALSSTAALGTSEFYVEVPKAGSKNSKREITPDENSSAEVNQFSVIANNQKVKRPLSINFAASSSMLNVSQTFDEKSMSASTPSVKELCDQAANITASDGNNSKNADPASLENKKDHFTK